MRERDIMIKCVIITSNFSCCDDYESDNMSNFIVPLDELDQVKLDLAELVENGDGFDKYKDFVGAGYLFEGILERFERPEEYEIVGVVNLWYYSGGQTSIVYKRFDLKLDMVDSDQWSGGQDDEEDDE